MLLTSNFNSHDLGDGNSFFAGLLPAKLVWDQPTFTAAWEMHPADRHWVKMLGKAVQTPRFQQAYGANYQYTGSMNNARPVPQLLRPLLEWAQQQVDSQLNGALLNWYEGPVSYIGPHNDSTRNLALGAPIVTLSFGEERIFRFTKKEKDSRIRTIDFPAVNGAVFVLPFSTNLAWKHSVPKSARYRGRRISVTLRAFTAGVLGPEQYWK